MSNHTPGPWRAAYGEYGAQWAVFAGHAVIAQCSRGMNPNPENSGAENDARLIAAAPELAEALTDMLSQLDGLGIADWHGAEGLDMTQARAALDKAGVK